GISEQEHNTLRATTPLGAALDAYTRLYQPASPRGQQITSRYCPECLTEPEPYWRKDWTNPLLVVCPDHEILLLNTCPASEGAPIQDPSLLGQPFELWQCTARPMTTETRKHKVHPLCCHDLRSDRGQQTTPAQIRAQRLLVELATAIFQNFGGVSFFDVS